MYLIPRHKWQVIGVHLFKVTEKKLTDEQNRTHELMEKNLRGFMHEIQGL